MADRRDTPDTDVLLQQATDDPAEARLLHQANVRAWDEAGTEYARSDDETIAFLRAGESSLHPIERANLARVGPLSAWCREALHLQCASGRDTLSLLTEGVARVTGVDISPVQIANARRRAAALGVDATFLCCDVLDVPPVLNGRFDLVYTGMGALCWLHDIEAWAATVARVLAPGGVLHVFDNHPMAWMWDDLSEDLRVYPGVSYFDQAASDTSWTPRYLPGLGGDNARKYERSWTFAEIVGAVLGAGLRLEQLGEHREEYFPMFPNLAPAERARIPMTFSLLARRPALE